MERDIILMIHLHFGDSGITVFLVAFLLYSPRSECKEIMRSHVWIILQALKKNGTERNIFVFLQILNAIRPNKGNVKRNAGKNQE